MKYYVSILLLLLAPFLVLAASDDLQFTTDDGAISVGGASFNISMNSVVSALTVNDSNFVVHLEPGSSITITSPDHYKLNNDAAAANLTLDACGNGVSSVAFGATLTAVDVTVTPDLTTMCGGPLGGGDGGGDYPSDSAGLGGGSPQVVTPTPTVVPVITVVPTVPPTSVVKNFTKLLAYGSRNTDVKRLQQFLVAQGYLTATPNGYFGLQTEKAVKQFQLDMKIVKKLKKSYSAGYGIFGPATRAKVNQLQKES